MKNKIEKLLPVALLVAVVVFDQVTKQLVVANIPVHSVGASFFGDFLRIVLVYNTGVAFSIGQGSGEIVRLILFKILPIVALGFVMAFYFLSDKITRLQRWAICGVVGGGIGNIIDRVFNPHGVIDFIDVKFYGLFGFERWPTFNIADSAVVVCGILLFVSVMLSKGGEGAEK
ncbi:signal peptidase II [Treponema saccharophilum]|uniref:Lipoprotein signal peptidase n=1 Tax=Treponema saccharophilum DSM 2985 TaxID=907348 RepID=H7EKR5_9SPIR|nr:signal peptidase II [Treponema saccharophilum]EIC01823.1 signal peptidase II [Treponema saccharophilum DSM 2985]BDC96791.1 lipoprotein signal peptidase [Treponema saccharophilum]